MQCIWCGSGATLSCPAMLMTHAALDDAARTLIERRALIDRTLAERLVALPPEHLA